MVGDLTFAEAKTQSLYGPISCRWERKAESLQLDVAIPVNSTATVYVPAADINNVTEGGGAVAQAKGGRFLRMEGPWAALEAQSGEYRFVVK